MGVAPLLLPTIADLGSNGSSSSLSLARVIGGNVLTSSPSIAKESDAPLLGQNLGSMTAMNGLEKVGVAPSLQQSMTTTLGNGLGNMVVKNSSKDGQASNGKWKDLFSSNHSVESKTKLVQFSVLNNASSCSLLENNFGNLKDV